MSTEILSAEKDAPLGEVIDLFLERSVRRVPIVHDQKLVGILSRRDLVRHMLTRVDEIAS